jgi:RNA polymerase sigma-70 factor (ECF subfamily)
VSGDEPALSGPAEVRADGSRLLADLFHQHAAFVWRVLRRLGLSAADAEDGTQEVFLVVKARLRDYQERGTARAWLFAICQNVARAHRNKNKRTQPTADVEARDDARDPERALQQAQAAALIDQFLSSLSEPQATVFHLSEIEGVSAPELAAALGVGVNTVYARLRLARKRFEAFVVRQTKIQGTP